MASSSSSTPPSTNVILESKYDVFLSFRGEDTRDNFTSHLYSALCRKHIETFIDNQLRRGDEISQSLLDAIEGSNISVIIFSEGYASSRWCLEELEKILECKNKNGQIVIPVFYRVDPSDVRHQSGAFGIGFSKLEERFNERIDKLQSWRTALRETANLSGFASHVIRPESKLTEEITNYVLKRLNDLFSSDNKDQLVGVESTIEKIESLLSIESKEQVYILGIWGIAGVGKTTIAEVIFDKISNSFEGSCFMRNVREESENTGGLSHLQQKLFSKLLGDANLKIDISTYVSKRLSRKKVFIVFDDVSRFEQMEFLMKGLKFAKGSRIIITTRDKHVLEVCRVDEVYEVKRLNHFDAVELFSRHTFRQNNPKVGYEDLSDEVARYANGVPLALQVLGRFLVGKSLEEWKSLIEKLQRMPNMDIQQVLKVSFDGLDREEKNIFLDIACFFKDEDRDYVMRFLDACGFAARIGIRVLIDKSLITISDDKIIMHDLLQEMGREIVRLESINNPGKRSRLWNHEDIYKILTRNMGTEAIEGISLDMSKIKEINLNPNTFEKMHNLRFIRFYSSSRGDNINKVHHFKGVKSDLAELRFFHWHAFPLKALPSKVQPENLVSLELPHSNVKQLWHGVQPLAKLKYIDLRYSEKLTRIPDLSQAANVDTLYLEGCKSLVETHSSIKNLDKLVFLNLRYCKNIKKFPEISSCNVEDLYLNGTKIKELPSSIESLSRLSTLDLSNCKRLESLPGSLGKLKSLKYLYLSGCSKLQRLPDELGDLEALELLLADRIAAREVPSSIVRLNNLSTLSFTRFRGDKQMGFLFPTSLSLAGLNGLTSLNLIDCSITELPESLGQLSSLVKLYLDKNYFERIPESIIQLSELNLLSLKHCERLKSLPELPSNLSHVSADHCTLLGELSGLSILFTPKSSDFQEFDFMNCFKLDMDEVREIAKDALEKILLIATTWWKEEDQRYFDSPVGCICYPGSEIPEWFSCQSMGSSMTLELPPGWFNNKLAGFALCAILSFSGYDGINPILRVVCECKVKTRNGDWRETFGTLFEWGDFISRPCNFESDHVCLGYNFSLYNDIEEDGSGDFSNEAFVQFYLADGSDTPVEDCKVKKCGMHLLYAQDFGESSRDPSGSFGSDDDDEEQELQPQS